MDRIIEKPEPSLGLVISTFAAVPYVHLALESWRRHCPSVPVLVSDDHSPFDDALRELCQRYGAEFVQNRSRHGRDLGDLSACVNGLEWAAERQLELLVKMSRRFIPLHNWVPGLQRLAYDTQYATYSNQCRHYRYGFRTECIALHVNSWCEAGCVEEIKSRILRNRITRTRELFVEAYLHNLARDVHKLNCPANREYERRHPRPNDADAYGMWTITADKRTSRKPGILWHDCDSPFAYLRAAMQFGLPYRLKDFAYPDQGCAEPKKVPRRAVGPGPLCPRESDRA